jgi:hypothetical protein
MHRMHVVRGGAPVAAAGDVEALLLKALEQPRDDRVGGAQALAVRDRGLNARLQVLLDVVACSHRAVIHCAWQPVPQAIVLRARGRIEI